MPASVSVLRSVVLLAALVSVAVGFGPARAAAGPEAVRSAPATVFVPLGGETFTLDVAADPVTRFRGLSGRSSIPRNGGLLFVHPRPVAAGMVMRDCPVAIDVAFLDAEGRVLATYEMPVEPPRGPTEAPRDYERRLPVYSSPAPSQFAIEVAGGRLAELGISAGDVISLDFEALAASAR